MKAQVVSFHCTLKNILGDTLSTTFSQNVVTHPKGTGDLHGLMNGLQNLRAGEKRKICVGASEAYGLYDPDRTRAVSRKRISSSPTIKIGDEIHLVDEENIVQTYRVTKILGDVIYLDANHPLAGQDLIFEVAVVAAREATLDEIQDLAEPPLPPHIH